MSRKNLKWLSLVVLIGGVLGFYFYTQNLAQQFSNKTTEGLSKLIPRKYIEDKQIEEFIKKRLEKEIEGEKPHVLKLIEGLKKAIPTSTDWSIGVRRLAGSRDLRALPVLCEALLKAKRPITRTGASKAIAFIEEYNKDTSALPSLRKALKDPVTNVKFHAALSLIYLGDKSKKTVKQIENVLEQLAKGENMENWTVDWGGYMGLEYMTKTEIEEQQVGFKEGMRKRAIDALGILGTKRALSVLANLSRYSKDYISFGDKLISISEYSKVLLEAAREDRLRCRPSLH